MLYIDENTMLACTLLSDDSIAGVDYKDLEKFVEVFKKNLSETKVEYILPFYPHNGLTHGYGSWQENFVCYAGRYFCRLDEEQEKKFKEEKISSLISELNKEGVEEMNATNIVLNSIEAYKQRNKKLEEPKVLNKIIKRKQAKPSLIINISTSR